MNQLILQDVKEAVSRQPERLDSFLGSLQSLQPAMGLSQRIKDTFAVKCANPPPVLANQSEHSRLVSKFAYFAAMLVGSIAFLCIFAYVFWFYLPRTAEMHRTGLPQEPDYFINREQEQEKVMRSVTGSISDRSRVITITGAPGYGKTTLANVCGHTFVSQGIPVRYVNLQRVCDIQGIVGEILYAVGSTDRYPSKMQLSRWAAQRQNGVLVLVLDNVDCFTLSGEKLKKFSELIKDYIVKPSLAIHVILTTQYQLRYTDRFQLIALDRLSEPHARELLLHRYSSLTPNVTTAFVNITEGNPLALQILSAVLRIDNAPPISTLLKQLHFDPVNALSPDSVHEKLNHVFNVAVHYLPEADHQCFLVVCQFPGSFDEASALAVMLHFVNESAPTCLGHLVDRSLLEYNRNTRRYNVMSLLKAYVNSTSQRYRAMVSQFFPVYVKHLLQTATKKQNVSEIHLQNYLKANYLGVHYLITGYVGWSNNISEVDTNVDLIVPFALSTFNILPLLQPVDTVEMFWVSVQKLTWNITSEGFAGQCHEYLDQAIEFESLLADYVLSTGKSTLMEAAGLSRRAQQFSVQVDNLQSLTASNCIRIVPLLRYLGQVAKYSHDGAVYQSILQTILHLALGKNHSSDSDADYNVGLLYFELNEYHLALVFLNRSLASNPKHFNAMKTMVLALQRSGQTQLAVDTTNEHLERSIVDYSNTERPKCTVAAESNDETAKVFLIYMDLFLTLNETELFTDLLLSNVSKVFQPNPKANTAAMEYYTKHCLVVDPSQYTSSRFMKCLSLALNVTRDSLEKMQFQLCQTRILSVLLTAYMDNVLKLKVLNGQEQNISKQVTNLFSFVLDWEVNVKNLNVCREIGTDSDLCQMSRSLVRALWQLQYEIAVSLANFYDNFGMPERSKEYIEIVLEKLPKSSVEKKWKLMINHKLHLAKIELSLGNYWNAVKILRSCSLTIDNHTMEPIHKAAESSTTWRSHDITYFADSHFSILVYQFHNYFNIAKLLSAVVSGTVGLMSHAATTDFRSHLLFVAIVALLWLLVVITLFVLGSTLYCIKFMCSCCSERHNCVGKIRLYLFDLLIVVCAFSHVVVFYAYVLHYHTTILLTYLNYL